MKEVFSRRSTSPTRDHGVAAVANSTNPSSLVISTRRNRALSDDCDSKTGPRTRGSRARSAAVENLLQHPREWFANRQKEEEEEKKKKDSGNKNNNIEGNNKNNNNSNIDDDDGSVCWLLLLSDPLLLHVLRFVAVPGRMVTVCKRLSSLTIESVRSHLRFENKLEANNDVMRVVLFLEQLTRPRRHETNTSPDDYDDHPMWATPNSRFRILVCEGNDVLSRHANSDAVSEIRLVHGKFWFYAVLLTSSHTRVFSSRKLNRKQAREILAAAIRRTRGDIAIAFQLLERPRYEFPDPVFGGEAKEISMSEDEDDSLQLDDKVPVDHKMGV